MITVSSRADEASRVASMFFPKQPTELDIPWEPLEGIVKGISAIDLNGMSIRSLDEAEDFIRNYGYDCQNPDDLAELAKVYDEALSFIERRFLDPEVNWAELGEKPLTDSIPASLRALGDPRELMLLAANGHGPENRWACAVLKVMHTISHINNAVLFQYFDEAKQQILSRYYKVISHSYSGEIRLGRPGDVQLSILGFETKDEKTRDSMIIKLLAKKENVAEELFDLIGVRIITHTPAEAILALELLRRNRMVIFPNIIPSRSRNSLIDFDDFKHQYQEALDTFQQGEASLEDTVRFIQRIVTDVDGEHNPQNTSTLSAYRSLHITQRQLIRVKHPGSGHEIRFFFPYEIQLVDEANYIENHSGASAHALYKQNQLVQARRRVLGPLFIALRKQSREMASLAKQSTT